MVKETSLRPQVISAEGELCVPFDVSTAYRHRQLSIFPKFLAVGQTGYIQFYNKKPNC